MKQGMVESKMMQNKGRPEIWVTNEEFDEIFGTLCSPKFLLVRKIIRSGLHQKPPSCPLCGLNEYRLGFYDGIQSVTVRCINCGKRRYYNPLKAKWTEK